MECWEDACRRITEGISKVLILKQHDYGHKNITDFGEFGVLVRVNDKVERLKNLYGRDNPLKPLNESIRDSWLDVAGYAVIALMLLDNSFNLDLKENRRSL